jgi:hypothetical protein
MSFQEFYSKYYNLDGYEHHYEEFYEAGATSRQAEIDELTKMLHEACDDRDYFCNELDKSNKTISKLLDVVDCNIEDFYLSHSTSKYDLIWFQAMSLVKKIIEEKEGGK